MQCELREELRLTTSHETDGKANTRKGSGIVFVYSSHCRFVVIDLNSFFLYINLKIYKYIKTE